LAQPADAGMREALPDDLRALGWAVAVHNDYRLNGSPHTFWLFTKDGRAVKGEGRTDAEALNAIRAALTAPGATTKSDGVEGHVETWAVRVTDKRDTEYNDAPVREVLMPDGEWRECIAVDDADARKT